MKLYARTLLFFLGVIGFQALITAGLILGLVSRDNQTDARIELREESSQVYTAYNSWVRILWRSAVYLKSDSVLEELSDGGINRLEKELFQAEVTKLLHDTGIDSYVIKDKESDWISFEELKDNGSQIHNFSSLTSEKDHPYVSLRLIDEKICLTATLQYESGIELFLFKQLNSAFYNHLTETDRSQVLISSDETAILQVAEYPESIRQLLKSNDTSAPYLEFLSLDLGKGYYNISFRNLGPVNGGVSKEALYLLVFLTDTPYRSLQYSIGRIVLLVTSITVLFTLILGLFFSGRITRPINRLIAAMVSIRSGKYDIKVPVNTLGEVRTLLEGFNNMALHLNHDRLTMDANIREITFLKDYNDTIIQSLLAGIIIVDSELIIEKVNDFFIKNFSQNFDTLSGKKLNSLNLPLLDVSIIERAHKITINEEGEWSGIKRGKTKVWEIKLYPLMQIDGHAPGRCVIELNDISRKVELEEKILQAEKLSSLSFLTAGIAHEINNPLSSILSNVQNLQSGIVPKENKISLNWIEQETQRIARIVRELLDFSRETRADNTVTDVNECLEDILRLTRYGRKPNTGLTITFNRAEDLPRALISPDELKQVVLNLVQNAVHAVNSRGNITVTTSLEKNQIEIAVEDNGCGIAPDVLGQIFDPFFTTKTNGEGTGLGLSIVYGIMGKNKGRIDVKSQEGLGTTITLTLPVGDISSDE